MTEGAAVFSDIAERYDRLNRILSLGQDDSWRRRAAEFLPAGHVLDLGAGTGAGNSAFGERWVTAVDPSIPMLALNEGVPRVAAAGEHLPFVDDCFDGVFSAFVFRNLTSVGDTLDEIHRILRPAGAAVIVDLSRPRGSFQRRLHRAGSAVFVPLVGRLAGSPGEYKYLDESLDKLPPPEELYAGGPLTLEKTWRMGPLGFVYAAVLRKE
ncbi:MAG: class I SAM-dependent methyltransferase [Acidimicrobiia bacterium]|nr:class I SAM-dependent methyltransferase [Acidimicrobiia bacterium]MBT8203483.1 class I SAM-dependent methyltransferase [Acidimicrobiia bacterium]NNF08706.1 class I SAM-dependent methyltransferase [Acidimicrobiia bacterium]NNL70431.1 class I SAM-dependent methyltransferase [Acidimicrobiia bacterium]